MRFLFFVLLLLPILLGCNSKGPQFSTLEVIVTEPEHSTVAVLRSWLDLFNVEAEYEELEKVCSDSINDIEALANEYLVSSEQVILPHSSLLRWSNTLPAIATLDRNGAIWFVIVERQEGDQLMVMDPMYGNVAMPIADFLSQLLVFNMDIPAEGFRQYLESESFLENLTKDMTQHGLNDSEAQALIKTAITTEGLHEWALITAATNYYTSSPDGFNSLKELINKARTGNPADTIPSQYWFVVLKADNEVSIRGNVLILKK